MNDAQTEDEATPAPLALCGELTRNLCTIVLIIDQRLAVLSTRDRDYASWVRSLAQGCREYLERCEQSARRLEAGGIDAQLLEDLCAEMHRAFDAPSVQQSAATSVAAVSLLLERLFSLLSQAFGFVRGIGEQQGFVSLASACGLFEAALMPESAPRSSASSLKSYPPRLLVFTYLATEPDLLDEVSQGDANRALRRLSNHLQLGQTKLGHMRVTDSQVSYVGKLKVPSLEFTTPVLRPERIVGVEKPLERTYRIWFGTDRSPVRPDDPGLGFNGTMDNRLHFGSCLVFVPRSHDVGSIGSSWIQRTFIKRSDDRLKLTLIKSMTRDGFQRGVSDELQSTRETRTALIYLHGFRVSFKEAAVRAAQISCDLGVEGVTAFYSWASAGKLNAYSRDEETVRLTVEHFIEFLDTLLSINGLERADIIAHSMGNRVLASVIKHLATASIRARIGHLILAAPDISRSEFNKVSTYYPLVATKRTTLYSCAKDKALAISSSRHDYLRIGYEPPVYCAPGIDSISASRVKLDLLGHSYIVSARSVIADLKSLLWKDLPPQQRALDPVPDGRTAEYWTLRKSAR